MTAPRSRASNVVARMVWRHRSPRALVVGSLACGSLPRRPDTTRRSRASRAVTSRLKTSRRRCGIITGSKARGAVTPADHVEESSQPAGVTLMCRDRSLRHCCRAHRGSTISWGVRCWSSLGVVVPARARPVLAHMIRPGAARWVAASRGRQARDRSTGSTPRVPSRAAARFPCDQRPRHSEQPGAAASSWSLTRCRRVAAAAPATGAAPAGDCVRAEPHAAARMWLAERWLVRRDTGDSGTGTRCGLCLG